MSRSPRPVRMAYAVGASLLALALSGCQSQPEAPAVATAASAAPAVGAPADGVDWTAYDNYMRAFVKCLNDRGLEQARYLGHDRPMDQELTGMPSDEGATVNPVVTQCSELVKTVERPVQDAPEKPSEEDLRQGRAFAACMRKNGLPDYPDPMADPAAADTEKDAELSAQLKTNPKFAAAQRQCAKEFDTQPDGPKG
jgi:hypothetical protein